MKKKFTVLVLAMYIVIIVMGCSNKEDDFREKSGEKVGEIEENNKMRSTEDEKSTLTKSYAEDEAVRKAQEEYMETLHSKKGESVVTRSEGESVSYTEIVKTEEAGKVDFYYYAFLNTSKEYESTLKSFMEEDDGIILEQNADALYIKMKRKDGMSTYFESVEESAIRGNEFETYVE